MKRRRVRDATELACPFCGEVSAISIDAGGGHAQSFVDDCTVCCRPRVVHVERDEESETGVRVWLERDDGF
jgi:hypothetical protein